MTTITYCRGVLAADTMAYLGPHEAKHARKNKLRRLPDGGMAGASSSKVGLTGALLDWVEAGCDPAKPPAFGDSHFELLVVGPEGSIKLYRDQVQPTEVLAKFFAIGSGSAYALGALSQGCGAVEAVKAAAEFDHFTGGEVDSLSIPVH